ncbi:hypothetical protein BT69DRAFT_672343 [Atractiella rhizophila]|nr:hypothetical protein BT69DRAFT_672343 [Atractiella rhizophila]
MMKASLALQVLVVRGQQLCVSVQPSVQSWMAPKLCPTSCATTCHSFLVMAAPLPSPHPQPLHPNHPLPLQDEKPPNPLHSSSVSSSSTSPSSTLPHPHLLPSSSSHTCLNEPHVSHPSLLLSNYPQCSDLHPNHPLPLQDEKPRSSPNPLHQISTTPPLPPPPTSFFLPLLRRQKKPHVPQKPIRAHEKAIALLRTPQKDLKDPRPS